MKIKVEFKFYIKQMFLSRDLIFYLQIVSSCEFIINNYYSIYRIYEK